MASCWHDILAVVRVTSFLLFTETKAKFHSVKTCPGMMQLSCNYESIIPVLHMCSCLQARICQRSSRALFHSLLNTYWWIVITWMISDTDSSRFPLWRISLKALTIMFVIDFIKATHFHKLVSCLLSPSFSLTMDDGWDRWTVKGKKI